MKDTIKRISAEAIDFYPTPEKLADGLLLGVDLRGIHTVLEPSAGKGDLLRPLAMRENVHCYRDFDVDCIELDPNLRQILKYNFTERKHELQHQINQIKAKYKYCEHRYKEGYVYYNGEKYVPIPDNDQSAIRALEMELEYFFAQGIHIVADDFLSFETMKTYDLILMNPPFSNGDMHLLKALKMQENGGNIICILNAETIRNPCTMMRQALVNQLEQYGASIEYIKNGFSAAERKTDVEIAVIKVSIPEKKIESDIFKRFQKAEEYEEVDMTCEELEVTDYIKAIVARFRAEAKSGVELIKQYKAMIPHMTISFDDKSYGYDKPILNLKCRDNDVSINGFLREVRYKYWKTLLSNPKFVGKLTSKLQEEYQRQIERLAGYDFSEFNIYTLSAEMNSRIKKGVEDEIIAMFDRLTEEHTWYPETKKNRHYYDGWKTNKAHKIDKKVIIPCYNVFDSYDGSPRVYNARGVLEDIERILNFLDGGMTRDVDFWHALKVCFNQGITKNIGLKYFKATFYKKGTVHLVFTCPELIERFNIYAAQYKKWLPPNYGKKAYTDMTAEEKQVIDGFQGEEAYNEILKNSSYYLKPVTSENMLMLEA